MCLEREEVTQRGRDRKRGDHLNTVRRPSEIVGIHNGLAFWAAHGLAQLDCIVEGLASGGHGGSSTLQEPKHGSRNDHVCQSVGLGLTLISEQARVGHVEVDQALPMESPDPDKRSHRGLNAKTDQLHGVLQLMAYSFISTGSSSGRTVSGRRDSIMIATSSVC